MKIEVTEKEFLTLLKMVTIGEWIINAYRLDEPLDEYINLEESLIDSGLKAGLTNIIEYNEEMEANYIKKEYADEIEQYIDEFSQNQFWEILCAYMTKKEILKRYSIQEINKMTDDEHFEKFREIVHDFEAEFLKNGIDNLELKI